MSCFPTVLIHETLHSEGTNDAIERLYRRLFHINPLYVAIGYSFVAHERIRMDLGSHSGMIDSSKTVKAIPITCTYNDYFAASVDELHIPGVIVYGDVHSGRDYWHKILERCFLNGVTT